MIAVVERARSCDQARSKTMDQIRLCQACQTDIVGEMTLKVRFGQPLSCWNLSAKLLLRKRQ